MLKLLANRYNKMINLRSNGTPVSPRFIICSEATKQKFELVVENFFPNPLRKRRTIASLSNPDFELVSLLNNNFQGEVHSIFFTSAMFIRSNEKTSPYQLAGGFRIYSILPV